MSSDQERDAIISELDKLGFCPLNVALHELATFWHNFPGPNSIIHTVGELADQVLGPLDQPERDLLRLAQEQNLPAITADGELNLALLQHDEETSDTHG